jgi:TonB family protein
MRRNLPNLRVSCSLVLLVFVIAAGPLHVQAANELEQNLRSQYGDKTLVLRNFYQTDRLTYDSHGVVLGSAVVGDWTVDGFVRVTSVSLSGERLTIRGERLTLSNGGQSFQLWHGGEKKRDKKNRKLRIEVEFRPDSLSVDGANEALARIFLTSRDRFVELVPDYWKPCISAASTGKEKKNYSSCSFPTEFAAIPGIGSGSEEISQSKTYASGESIARIGRGITAPKVLMAPTPEFSEEARSAKYQGVVLLSLVVDKNGQTRNVRIVRPLGMGLDQKAVEAVTTWRFTPAEKDGEPVAVEMAAEVNFHL